MPPKAPLASATPEPITVVTECTTASNGEPGSAPVADAETVPPPARSESPTATLSLSDTEDEPVPDGAPVVVDVVNDVLGAVVVDELPGTEVEVVEDEVDELPGVEVDVVEDELEELLGVDVDVVDELVEELEPESCRPIRKLG